MPYTYKYPRPALTVDAVIFKKAHNETMLLLIQRDQPPFEGQWALPGGFVDMDETLDHAIQRELMEETGLANIYLEQFRTFGDLNRDPRGRTVSVVFYGFAETDAHAVAGDDARNVDWFPLPSLPQLAFDHNLVITTAIEYLHDKLI